MELTSATETTEDHHAPWISCAVGIQSHTPILLFILDFQLHRCLIGLWKWKTQMKLQIRIIIAVQP